MLPPFQEFTYDIVKSFHVIGELFACIGFHCKAKEYFDIFKSDKKTLWCHGRAFC